MEFCTIVETTVSVSLSKHRLFSFPRFMSVFSGRGAISVISKCDQVVCKSMQPELAPTGVPVQVPDYGKIDKYRSTHGRLCRLATWEQS